MSFKYEHLHDVHACSKTTTMVDLGLGEREARKVLVWWGELEVERKSRSE